MASLMDILKQAGFTGQGLQTAYAVAMAESGGDANAHNGNAGTGDNSYGLFQINMLGAMGPERLKQYGLSSNNDLFDMEKNARVAYQMSKGGTDWSPWSTYKRGDYKKYLGQTGATVLGGTTATDAPGAAGTTATDQTEPTGDILGTGNIGPGLAAPMEDPFATVQEDPTAAAPKAPATTGTATPGATASASASSSFRDRVISYAMQQLGTPYSWGGGGTNGASTGTAQGANTVGFDCSSLMQYAFGKAGFAMPRVSYDQLAEGQHTSIADLRPGDLVGFENGSHVALYLGGGRILEAPHTGANVRVRSLGQGGFDATAFGIRLSLPGDH